MREDTTEISPWLSAFRLDLRSLALGRIFVGTVVFCDFLQALQWRNLYYSEQGVLPRADFAATTALQTTLSPYLLLSAPVFTTLLLLLSAACALAFTLGYKTRWTTPLLWLAVYSLQERNPWILIGGDAWVRATLFWLIFLPVNEYFSWDRTQSHRGPNRTTVANAASVGLILQVVYIYVWSGIAKYGEGYQEGNTIYRVLSGPEFGQERAQWLLYFPELIKRVSQIIPYLEVLAGLLLIVPFLSSACRRLGVASLILMHLGIWYSMDLYHFSAIAVGTLLMLWLPDYSEERLAKGYLPKWLSAILLIWCLTILVYNPFRLRFEEFVSLKFRVRAEALGLDQFWQLFAPSAPTATFIIFPVAVYPDGHTQNLGYWGEKRSDEPGFNDPDFHVRLSRLWRSLTEIPQSPTALRHYAAWYSRRWSQLYPEEEISSIRLYYRAYRISPDYEDIPPDPPLLLVEFKVIGER